MKKFEHALIHTGNGDLNYVFNSISERQDEGFELVAVVPYENGLYFFLKRDVTPQCTAIRGTLKGTDGEFPEDQVRELERLCKLMPIFTGLKLLPIEGQKNVVHYELSLLPEVVAASDQKQVTLYIKSLLQYYNIDMPEGVDERVIQDQLLKVLQEAANKI